MKAMILAAGYGKRLRPLTDHTPKPLVPVGGKPLIVHHLEKLATAGIQDIVINLGHLGHKIPEALGNGASWGLSITYSEEGPDPLETGGGIAKALPLLGQEPFLLINGDVWTDMDISSLSLELLPGDLAHLILVSQPSWRKMGDFNLDKNRVLESQSPSLLYSGIAIYHPMLLEGAKVERFSIVPRLKQAIAANQVAGSFYDGAWDDVGTPERLQSLQAQHGT